MPKQHDGRKSTPGVRLEEPPKSAEEIKAQGEAAAKLLDSPVYNLAYRSVILNLQDEWIQTSPHEDRKRDGLYHRIQGLSAVTEELAVMVSLAQEIGDSEIYKERKIQLAYDENAGFKL